MKFKKHFWAVLLCLFSILMLFPEQISFAKAEDSERSHVYDYEGYLSDSEVTKLEKKLVGYSEDAGCQIIVITSNQLDGKDAKTFLEDFFDAGRNNGTILADASLLVFGKNSSGRFAEIQGYGLCEYYLNNDRIEYTLDEVIPYLIDEEYYDAFIKFAKEVEYYMHMDRGVSFDPTKPHGETATASSAHSQKPFYYRVWFQLLVSVAIGAIVVACMAYTSGGTMSAGGNTYYDSKHSGVTAHKDVYIRTSVTKIKKPEEPKSGGGGGYSGRSSGGGGVSSGGNSHSGGGRSF